ncbi:MAG TPA: glycosyl transferase family 2 [Bacteroidales bacterium]|nr:glycosyl transferase family 2 [Bacteroidales bacterium]
MISIILQIVFWVSVAVMFHSYVLYPFLLWILMRITKKTVFEEYTSNDELPFISILIAAHNEETVIAKKIESINNTSYPLNKIEIIIGSDCSTDSTNSIVKSFEANQSNLKLVEFYERQGKIGVVNKLVDIARGEIIISTDANVFFEVETIFELVKRMKDSSIGLVDSRMVNTGLNQSGISIQESTYITHEVLVKYREGMLWGTMIGPFGGCFAIHKELFVKPPENFLVDDFYINMKVLEQGKKCLNSLEARVYEDVSNELSEEFRRKVRIAQGNFQNLKTFRKMLWPPTKPLAFAFMSHKVIRWIGPLFIIFAIISVLFLQSILFYRIVALAIGVIILIPFVDFLLKKLRVNLVLLRFVTHFFSMNIALLVGLIKYLKGVNSNVWQPTQRNQ